MSVVLVGAPGAGKSTVGKRLARRLGVGFVDVDAAIEREAGKLIAEIFADEGEAHFRQLEERATIDLVGAGGERHFGTHHALQLAVGRAEPIAVLDIGFHAQAGGVGGQ